MSRPEVEQLIKLRALAASGMLLVGGKCLLETLGYKDPATIPTWVNWILTAFVFGYVVHLSWKLHKLG